jgi:hypothetical protein
LWRTVRAAQQIGDLPDKVGEVVMIGHGQFSLYGFALLEKLFINLFDMQRVFDPASYIVADHQACELIAIYQHNPLAQMLCIFLGVLPCSIRRQTLQRYCATTVSGGFLLW